MKNIFSSAILSLLLLSCGPKIYTSSNFSSALAKHKTVAILPAEVTMQVRPAEAKKMTQEQLDDLATKTGYDIQEKMYGWLLRKSNKYSYTVKFQDVTKTNSLLKQAGISYTDLKTTDRA